MARLDVEQQEIDMLVSVGVDRETAARFRKFLAGNGMRDEQAISEIVAWVSPLLRAGFKLFEISAPKK